MKKIIVLACILALGFVFSSSSYAGCKVGDKAEVLWQGKWYKAHVLKVKGNQCYIHYDGYGKKWDEWVGPNRIRIKGASTAATTKKSFSVGDPVSVKWKGTWYPAHVIAVGKTTWKIHYDGYNSSWDEWVGARRIRAR